MYRRNQTTIALGLNRGQKEGDDGLNHRVSPFMLTVSKVAPVDLLLPGFGNYGVQAVRGLSDRFSGRQSRITGGRRPPSNRSGQLTRRPSRIQLCTLKNYGVRAAWYGHAAYATLLRGVAKRLRNSPIRYSEAGGRRESVGIRPRVLDKFGYAHNTSPGTCASVRAAHIVTLSTVPPRARIGARDDKTDIHSCDSNSNCRHHRCGKRNEQRFSALVR